MSEYRVRGGAPAAGRIFDQLDSWNMSDDNRFSNPTRMYYKMPNVHQPMQNSFPAGEGQACPIDRPDGAMAGLSATVCKKLNILQCANIRQL